MAFSKSYVPTSRSKYNGVIKWDKIDEFQFDDNEKVSVTFLLCEDPYIAMEILVKNIIKSNPTRNAVLNDIIEWAMNQKVEHFDEKFIEALILVQNRKLINMLSQYSPEIKKIICDISDGRCTFVHAVRKVLFQMCESLYVNEFKTLILLVKQDYKNESHFVEYNPHFMELNILSWICQRYISDGVKDMCDVYSLIEHLRYMNKEDLAKKLEVVDSLAKENFNTELRFSNSPCVDGFSNSPCEFDVVTNGCSSRDNYVMDPLNMGICIIVNQKNFNTEVVMCDCEKELDTRYWNDSFSQCQRCEKELDTRYGTDIDRDWLHIVFNGFGYEVIILEDINHVKFEEKIKNIIKTKVTQKHSSLILCLLTHGMRGAVYCSDNVPVQVERIQSWILGEQCPQLLTKPKVLIIQGCQGDYKQNAKFYYDDARLTIDGINDSINYSEKACPPTADLITFWATVPGYCSIRNEQKGTWFIRSLCKQLLQQGHQNHVNDIFTSVKHEVSQMKTKGYEVMMSKTEDTIRKKMHFPYVPQNRFSTAKSILERYLFDYLLCVYQARYKMYLEFKQVKSLVV